MNSVQIEYFLALCKYKNYSETARRLFISQPTISKQIASMEEELGVKLFERSTNSLMLTMQGAIMKKAFSEALQTIADAKTDALNYSKHISDTLRLGILEGSDIGFFLSDLLMETIRHFRPSIDIDVIFLSHRDMNTCLHENTIDIGITLSNEVKKHSDLEYTKLRNVSMGIVAHNSLNVIRDGILDLTKIRTQPFFFTRDGSLGIKDYLKRLENILDLDPTQYHCVPNIDSILVNVELGRGIAIIPSTMRIENNADISYIPLESETTTIVAAWNRKNDNNSRNRIIKRMRRLTIESRQK